MNGSSQFCFHRDHSRMSKRHQEPALVFRELKPKCCFVLTRFQVFEVQGTEFWKPQAALGFGSSHTDSEEQCLEKCECPLCLGTVTVLSACPWRPLGVTKGPRKLTDAGKSTLEPLLHKQFLEARGRKERRLEHLLRPIAYVLRRKSLRMKPELRRQF